MVADDADGLALTQLDLGEREVHCLHPVVTPGLAKRDKTFMALFIKKENILSNVKS